MASYIIHISLCSVLYSSSFYSFFSNPSQHPSHFEYQTR